MGERSELVKNKLNSSELVFADIVNYNESDNKTKFLACTTCDNISEVAKPTHFKNHAVCSDCECFI